MKGKRMEVPPPLCQTASQQGGRGEVINLAGGAWRGLEECWGFGVNFYQKAFIQDYLFSITCVLWRGRLADVPLFSRVEREEMTWMKVKVFSFYMFSCLGFIIYYVSA